MIHCDIDGRFPWSLRNWLPLWKYRKKRLKDPITFSDILCDMHAGNLPLKLKDILSNKPTTAAATWLNISQFSDPEVHGSTYFVQFRKKQSADFKALNYCRVLSGNRVVQGPHRSMLTSVLCPHSPVKDDSIRARLFSDASSITQRNPGILSISSF